MFLGGRFRQSCNNFKLSTPKYLDIPKKTWLTARGENLLDLHTAILIPQCYAILLKFILQQC